MPAGVKFKEAVTKMNKINRTLKTNKKNQNHKLSFDAKLINGKQLLDDICVVESVKNMDRVKRKLDMNLRYKTELSLRNYSKAQSLFQSPKRSFQQSFEIRRDRLKSLISEANQLFK